MRTYSLYVQNGKKGCSELFLICCFPLNNVSMLLKILALTSPQMLKGNSTITSGRLSMRKNPLPWKCRFSSSDQSKWYLTAMLKQNLFKTFYVVKDKFRISLQYIPKCNMAVWTDRSTWCWTPTSDTVEPLPAWCGSPKMCAWAQKLPQ